MAEGEAGLGGGLQASRRTDNYKGSQRMASMRIGEKDRGVEWRTEKLGPNMPQPHDPKSVWVV